MQLRLRSLIAPLAGIGALLLRRFGSSPKALDTSFYMILLLASGVFIWLSTTPFSQSLLAASVALVFVCALMEEVRREFGVKDTEASRYADLILYGGIIYYLINGNYVNFYLSQRFHLFLGGALVLGIYVLNKTLELTVKGRRTPGLEVPAERLLFLTVFAVTGYNHRAYEDFLLAGMALLTFLLYAYSILLYTNYRGFSVSTKRIRSYLVRVLGHYQGGVEKMKVGGWMVYRFLRSLLQTPPAKVKSPGEASSSALSHGYNFTVMVLNAQEQPVADATVTMTGSDGAFSDTKYTDHQGKCVFSNLGEGQYTISVEAEGLPGRSYERYINMDSGEVFRLHSALLDLSVVVNDSREMRPIPDALVTLETADGETHERRTDNLGVAYFDGLPGGYATLQVEAAGYVGKTRRVDPATENMVSVNMMRRQVMEVHGSLLVEYMEIGGAEEAVGLVVDAYREQGGKLCLVSTSSLLRNFALRGVETIDFSSALPEDIEIILGELPSGGVMLFEAVTELIHRLGLEEALRFMEKLLSFAREKEVSLVAFINKGAHGERIAAMFEEFFDEVAEYVEGGLVAKGGVS